MGISLVPLNHGANSNVKFGAQASGVDLACLSDTDFQDIETALYEHLLIVFKDQGHLTPEQQFEFTRRFDPDSDAYGLSDDVLHSEKAF